MRVESEPAMLHHFLEEHRTEIIARCREMVRAGVESSPTSDLLDQGLPIFYNELIDVLRRKAAGAVDGHHAASWASNGDAAAHGRESLRLGYSISQVVHSYGAVCQVITELVQSRSYKISNQEFQNLNMSLDCAIAEAVTEYNTAQHIQNREREIERLGFLVHEMRNSLTAATLAYQMIHEGRVGVAGVTGDVLRNSHERMNNLIHSATAEIRLRGESELRKTTVRLADIVADAEAAATIMRNSNQIRLVCEVDPAIHVTVDRQLLFSALSNLVHNAMKFSRIPGTVHVRGSAAGGRVQIEVEDECGGLQGDNVEELFELFVQKGLDRSGLGLGLPLSRRAVELHGGTLSARNLPGKGCVFTIDLPFP